MMIVLLCDFRSGGIVRHDPVVTVPDDKEIIVVWIELYYIRYSAIGKCLYYTPRLCIP